MTRKHTFTLLLPTQPGETNAARNARIRATLEVYRLATADRRQLYRRLAGAFTHYGFFLISKNWTQQLSARSNAWHSLDMRHAGASAGRGNGAGNSYG